MTEEEKAEEQCKKDFCTRCLSFERCERSIALCSKATNYCKSLLIEKLEKENAELKKKLKGFENGEVAWQGDMDKTIKQNLELKAQIEKMKCCENCNNLRKDFDLCLYSGGDKDYFCRLRKWELAE